MSESLVLGMLVLAIVTGGALGALLVWRKMTKTSNLQTESLLLAQQKLHENQQQLDQLSACQEQLHFKQTELAVLTERVESLDQQYKHIQQQQSLTNQQNENFQHEISSLRAENVELSTRQQEKELHFVEQLSQLEKQKNLLSKEFENIANRIFDAKGKTFSENSRQSLGDLLKPFRQQIGDFRQKVEDIHHKDTQQQALLRSELGHLKELNKQITEEAHQLATALKGQKKTQGNWGELILENVLDRSGLQLGKDYKREVSFNVEGGRQRPDAIVYLPENKHLIIDAKVSLNAYTRYMNSDDDVERKQALKEHVSAIADRIKELSDRNYFELPGLNSPEMVFMFIPIESAFVEALRADEGLFQKALEQNVLVATPTTLLTSLNIVRQLWRFENQNIHTAELAEKAGKMYDKFNTFLGSMERVGRSLDNAKDSYDKAFSQLYSGRGNLIKQANEFKKLGVSVKAELSESLVDRAELELDHMISDKEI